MAEHRFRVHELDNIKNAISFTCSIDDLSNKLPKTRPHYSIVSQNIRSIFKNIEDFNINLSMLPSDADIIILTECWLNPDIPLPAKPGYSSYCSTNKVTLSDGVVFYIKDYVEHKVKEVFLLDATCLEVKLNDCTILGIYRSPSNANTTNFITSLDNHLNMPHLDKNVIITGDINVNILEGHKDSHSTNYLEILSTHGLLPAHRLNTRINSCIDHTIINLDPNKFNLVVALLETTVTDHLTSLVNIYSINKTYPKKHFKTVTNFADALQSLREQNLDELLNINDPDILTKKIINTISLSLTSSTKTVKVPSNKRILKPWITPGILRCIQNRNKLQKQLKLDEQNEILKLTYRRYRNYCNNLIKKLKRQYERDLLNKTKNNNKQLWNSIKTITNLKRRENKYSELLNVGISPHESANLINKHFINIGRDLASKIDKEHMLSYTPTCIPQRILGNSIGVIEPDVAEVKTIITHLKTDSAAGNDEIPTKFLKMAVQELAPLICHLSSLCFDKGKFPSLLKHSIIYPVHKSGEKSDINNYRPISVLTAISKIIEKLINRRLISYLKKYKLLSESQFGFREGKGTEDAVLTLTNDIICKLDAKFKTLCVFLDLQKAFDTVSVPTLVDKLEKIGIRGTFLDLIRDYLSKRIQQVKLDANTFSAEDFTEPYGVPQGSVLGPTLFLIYINDLTELELSNGRVISYADDTALLFHGNSWNDVFSKAQFGIDLVTKWLNTNLLTLNIKKTNYITFSLAKACQPDTNLKLIVHTCNKEILDEDCGCHNLERVFCTRYLGIQIDQHLSWHKHIEMMTSRIRKFVWLFKYLRHIAGKDLLLYIYKSLVQSIICYCLPIWGGAYKTYLLLLERAQRTLLKIILFKKPTFGTKKLYEESNVLTVRQLYVLNCVVRRHKMNIPDLQYRKKRNPYLIFTLAKVRTTFARNQFQNTSALIYNRLNKQFRLHEVPLAKCKNIVTAWLKEIDYDETENLLKSIL
jgi:hypothetical protein